MYMFGNRLMECYLFDTVSVRNSVQAAQKSINSLRYFY